MEGAAALKPPPLSIWHLELRNLEIRKASGIWKSGRHQEFGNQEGRKDFVYALCSIPEFLICKWLNYLGLRKLA